MVSVSVVPAVCWSVATSRSSRSVFILSKIFGAHSFNSPRFASCSVNSNWVRLGRPPRRTSCAACMNSRAPCDLFQLWPQPGDDLLRRGIALVSRLQRDVHAAGVQRASAAADEHRDARDIGIGLHDLAKLLLMVLHVCERNVLRRLRRGRYQAVILLREKPLWNDDEQINRQTECRKEDDQGRQPPTQHQIEAAFIGVQQCGRSRARSIRKIFRAASLRASAGSAMPSSASASTIRSATRRSPW